MEDFKYLLLSTKCVSIWGIGYLGYTMLLRLQSKGFRSNVHDFNKYRLDSLTIGKYPSKLHKDSWTSKGYIPLLDLSKISIEYEMDNMFQNKVHIISYPFKTAIENTSILLNSFLYHKHNLQNSLILFQSAETPGYIESNFINPLKDNNIDCSFGTIFRTDWSIEEFSTQKSKQVISGYDEKSIKKTQLFLNMIAIEACESLQTVREAEIYECSRKTLQLAISSFMNQLMMAYPETNIRKLAKLLNQNIQLEDINPSIGTIEYKYSSAISFLVGGSRYPERFTILQNVESANASAIINYAEIIIRHSIINIVVLGICEKGDQKDIPLTRSLLLTEKLLSEGLKVWIHDPFFVNSEISKLLPGAYYIENISDAPVNDCFIVMTDHNAYRYMTQKDLDRLGISSAKLIIDSVALWKDLSFSKKTFYHIPGDGKLASMEQ